jgi:hypothetical protein
VDPRRFRGALAGPPHVSLRGRRGPVNVTNGRSRSASLGPTPRTSQRASMAPKAPTESRFATMRLASAGPIPGSDSISSAVARSRSTIRGTSRAPAAEDSSDDGASTRVGEGGDGASALLRCRAVVRRCRERALSSRRAARTESTRSSCLASASPCAEVGGGKLDRVRRTAVPDSATIARNQSALRSLGVGTCQQCIAPFRSLTSFRCMMSHQSRYSTSHVSSVTTILTHDS